MFSRLLDTVFKGYGLLLSLAAGGFIFANLFGVLAGSVHFMGGLLFGNEGGFDLRDTQSWIHWGWCFRVLFALIGDVIAFRKHRKRKSSRQKNQQAKSNKCKFGLSQKNQTGRRYGLFASTGIVGVLGAFLGAMLGGSFLLIWFSITYSPFAPQEWVSSVSLEQTPVNSVGSDQIRTTDHPVALIAFVTPIVFGAAIGAAVGAVCGVYEDE